MNCSGTRSDGYYCLSAVSHHELLVHIHFHLWNSLVPGPGMRGYVVGQAGLSVPVNRALYTLCLAREELKDICIGGLRSCPLKEVFIPHAQAGKGRVMYLFQALTASII